VWRRKKSDEQSLERNLRDGELTAQLNPGFTAQVDVQDQADPRVTECSKEVLGGSKNLDLQPVSLESTTNTNFFERRLREPGALQCAALDPLLVRPDGLR
jgi:hypothetical protein